VAVKGCYLVVTGDVFQPAAKERADEATPEDTSFLEQAPFEA